MNIFVDPSLISEVLLKDGWHVVVPGTFFMGKYALVEPNLPAPAAPGFTFHESGGASIAGPMSSVLAVRRSLAARTTEVPEESAAAPPAARPPAARPPAASPPAARPPAPKPQSEPEPKPPTAGRDWWEP